MEFLEKHLHVKWRHKTSKYTFAENFHVEYETFGKLFIKESFIDLSIDKIRNQPSFADHKFKDFGILKFLRLFSVEY